MTKGELLAWLTNNGASEEADIVFRFQQSDEDGRLVELDPTGESTLELPFARDARVRIVIDLQERRR